MKKKLWAVIWDKSAWRYGAKKGQLCVDNSEAKVKCKCHSSGWHWVSLLTIFPHKKDAEAWKDNNPDFKVVSCILII